MDLVTAFEVYERIAEIYETYMTRSIILAAIGGFTLGIIVCLIAFSSSTYKAIKKKETENKDK